MKTLHEAASDRELLEAAAKAAGMPIRWYINGFVHLGKDGLDAGWWNPLTDDGDALRLAVKLRIVWGWYTSNAVWARHEFNDLVFKESHERNGQQDEQAALRRAIVRAAAAMATEGKS